jgi:hypothetical protein
MEGLSKETRSYLSQIGALGGRSRSVRKTRTSRRNFKRAVRCLRRLEGSVLHGRCECGCGRKTEKRLRRPPGRRWTTDRKGYEVCLITGCWIPHRHPDENGYTRSVSDRGNIGLHRCVWQLWFGPVPAARVLDRLCRTRECVNPFHLEPVTRQESVRRGKATKLSEADVARIRRLFEAGRSTLDLARDFGISETYCRSVALGRRRNVVKPSLGTSR